MLTLGPLVLGFVVKLTKGFDPKIKLMTRKLTSGSRKKVHIHNFSIIRMLSMK
jgi:hypothetical protein